MSYTQTFASLSQRVLPNPWNRIAFAAVMAILAGRARSHHGLAARRPG